MRAEPIPACTVCSKYWDAAAGMDVSPFLALLLIGLVSLILFFSLSTAGGRTADGRRSLPPSPPGFPVLGHLPLLGSLPHRNLTEMAKTHGPVMLVRLGRVPAVVVSSAAAAKEALKTHDLAMSSRPGGPMIDRLVYGRIDVAFAPYSESWRQGRRVLVLHLLTQRRVLSFRRLREQEAAALVARVRASGVVNLGDALISYTSNVILRAAFGDDTSYELDGGRKLRDVFSDFQELVGSGTLGELVPWLSWVDSLRGLHAKATRTFEALDGLLERVIADHLKRRGEGGGGSGDDDDSRHRSFVDVLLDVSEAEEEAGGFRIDMGAIKGIIMDIFIGGSDTTSTTMEFAMAQLINHPDKMRRLQKEIRAVVGDDDRVTEDHLDKLSYLECVIKESQRLYPPGTVVARETIEDTELLGYSVPRHTRVIINAWAIGRDPATWERAKEFLPERFADQDMVVQDFTSLPFGYGRRGCPGIGFAMPNIKLVLASLLYHFDWELPAGEALTVDLTEKFGLAIRLKKALHLVPKPWSISKKATFPEA